MPLRSSMSVSCCWWLAKRASFPPLRGYLLSVFPSSHTFSTRRENSELDASSSSYSSWAGEEEDHLPPDKIHLNDLQFHAYHGVLPSEKSLGQKFLINVEMKKKLAALEKQLGEAGDADKDAQIADLTSRLQEFLAFSGKKVDWDALKAKHAEYAAAETAAA